MSNIITELKQIIEEIKTTKILEPIKITEAIKIIKTICVCESCKTDISISLETAIPCDLCSNGWDNEDELLPLFCKECTLTCNTCELIGCKKCVEEKVCWECDYNMCNNCIYTDNIMCGCFGECYSCGKDVDRGSDGWPCLGCYKWYCCNCRECENNSCKDCGPESGF